MSVVIGLTGLSGSGKSEITNYFEKKNAYGVVRLGTYVRKLYTENNFWGSVEMYAEHFRFSTVAKRMIADIEKLQKENEIVIVDSLRTVADFLFFKEYAKNFKLIMVVADKDKRLERLSSRGRKGDVNNELELQGHDYWEMSYGIDKLMVLADKFVVNNRSILELEQEVEQYIAHIHKLSQEKELE